MNTAMAHTGCKDTTSTAHTARLSERQFCNVTVQLSHKQLAADPRARRAVRIPHHVVNVDVAVDVPQSVLQTADRRVGVEHKLEPCGRLQEVKLVGAGLVADEVFLGTDRGEARKERLDGEDHAVHQLELFILMDRGDGRGWKEREGRREKEERGKEVGVVLEASLASRKMRGMAHLRDPGTLIAGPLSVKQAFAVPIKHVEVVDSHAWLQC